MRRATIKDIASRAGVTTTTVSRALNNKPDISPATKARIQAIAEEIGYVPSTLARSLVTQRTHTIGLAIRTISDMWVAEIVPAVEESLRQAGYEVFLSTHYASAEREQHIVETFHSRQVDGIIVISSVQRDKYVTLQQGWKLPIVLISPLIETSYPYIVRSDCKGGSQTATEHLIALEHHKIGYIGIPTWIIRGQDRLNGYRQALHIHGIEYDPSLIVLGDGHQEGGQVGIQRLMSLSPSPTAIVCFNDLTAVGALRGAKLMGIRVPGDVSIIGFDNVPMAEYVDPPLSTIHQDTQALGSRAGRMLLDLIAGRETEAPIVLETELVERESTAKIGTPPSLN